MEKLYKNYVDFEYDETKKIFHYVYLPETKNMADEEFREFIGVLLLTTDKLCPEYVINDDRKRLYAYDPDMQEWASRECVMSWGTVGVKKYVQIMAEEFIAKLSAEQVADIVKAKYIDSFEDFQIRFIESYEEAIQWVNE
jgi:hypothetical protein